MISNDVMNSKVNAMKSYFSYLFNVFSDGSVHCIYQNTCIFDTTPEERREIEKILIKYSKVFSWTYEDMLGIDKDIAQHNSPTKEENEPVK